MGEKIGGKTITGLNFGRGGLFGDPIAFQATFDDGSQRMYTMNLTPPPFELRITGVMPVGPDLRLSFSSVAGTSYEVQSHPSVSSGDWATLPASTQSGTGGILQFTVSNALTQTQQFYRIRQLP